MINNGWYLQVNFWEVEITVSGLLNKPMKEDMDLLLKNTYKNVHCFLKNSFLLLKAELPCLYNWSERL